MINEVSGKVDPYLGLQRGLTWSLPFALVIGTADLAMGKYFMGVVDLLVFLGLYVCLRLAKRRYHLPGLQNFAVFIAAFVFLAALLDGGLAGVGFIWSIGFPMVACFIAGARPGLYWSVAYVAVVALALFATQQTEGLMHYTKDPLIYSLAAYSMFAGFAYFMAFSREHRESLLLQARQQLQHHIDQLAESEANYSAVLATTPNAIGVHCDGRWVYANPAAVKMFGAASDKDIIGDHVMDYVHPDHRAMVAERMRQMKAGEPAPLVEEKLLRKNGEVFEAEMQASPIVFEGKPAVLTICRDITGRKAQAREVARLQAQLEHAQRLESLGVMAGGIAHDFNNLLAAIMGNVELAGLDMDPGSREARYLANADEACERASALCRQMLAYAGKGEFVIKPINLYRYLQGMRDLLKASLGKGIKLHLRLHDGLPEVMVDEAQFQQVILNLMVNASDAIGGGDGAITVEARAVEMSKMELTEFMNGENLAAGRYVSISVRDNGPGMDEKTRAKIFDPFFTTKKTGSGLGLSAILGIVQRHEGAIRVVSEPCRGAEFTILLPLARAKTPTKRIDTHDAVHLKGQGVVLLVDDEERVRDLVGGMLAVIGFEVVYAENGLLGVEMFRKYQKDLVAVLLDMTMPQMGGIDAMRLMREINPDIPILLVSGYSEQETHELPVQNRLDGFIQKPFRLIDLRKALKGVLRG